MRIAIAFAAVALLTACGLAEDGGRGPVDLSTLPPLSGREQALLVGADGAMRSGNLAAAERDYQSAVAASTGHVEAHVALAGLYATQRQIDKQRGVLERARVFQPNHPRVNYMLGKLELAENQYEAAQASFGRGLLTSPKDVDLMTASAIAHDMVGRHVAAQTIYQRAITQSPGTDLSGVRTNLAMSYLLSNEPKKAVAVLKDEVKKTGASPVTRHNMALAYGMLGRNAEAKALVHGDIDEETRKLALARLKEYVSNRSNEHSPAPIAPIIPDTKPSAVKKPS